MCSARRGGSEMNDYSAVIRLVLRNILSGVAKMHDAPMSAQTHFDAAIDQLAKVTTWRPDDPELLEIISSAKEHMKHYERAI